MYPREERGAKFLKSQKYYRDRAAYLRTVAKTAGTEKLRESCLEAARQFDGLAELAAEEEADLDEDDEE
jgi:hypothetical protein